MRISDLGEQPYRTFQRPRRDQPYPDGSRCFRRIECSQLLTRRPILNLGVLYVLLAMHLMLGRWLAGRQARRLMGDLRN